MNEDYLWDKNGMDAEIERLENALQTFRYQETAAPVIPVAIVPFKSKNRFSLFRLGFAFATCAAILAVGSFSIWSYVANKNSNAADSAKIITAPNSAPVIQTPTPKKPDISTVGSIQTATVKPIQIVQRSPKQRFTKARKTLRVVNSKSEKSDAEMVQTATIAQLSGEEKYAYDQLMLALSITSSKLKIVKEKLGVAENQVSVPNVGK